MKNIVLLCSGGMSTSLLVNKIKEIADGEDYPITIAAYGLSEAPRVVPDSDIVLLGPQVRFNLNDLKAKYPDKLFDVIDMRAYGTMDGAAVLKMVKTALD